MKYLFFIMLLLLTLHTHSMYRKTYSYFEVMKLHSYAAEGNLKEVKKLIEITKIPVDEQDQGSGYTALHYAMVNNHLHVVRYLVDEAKADISIKSKTKETALDLNPSLAEELNLNLNWCKECECYV